MENTQSYTSSLSERYPSKEMKYLFSPEMKFRTWRKLWIALAETEQELGLHITDEQIAELKAAADDINYDEAKERERDRSPRRYVPRIRLRTAVPESQRDHSPGRDLLLCWR